MPHVVPAKLSSALAFARALVRWDEWYDSKVPLFLVCMYYAALSRPAPGARLLGEMGFLLVLLCAYAAFGHMVNDFSDRRVDRAAGKRKVLATFSEPRARALVLLAALAGPILAVVFYFERPDVIAVVGIAYVLAALYSLPPARLKERRTLGLIAAAVAQRTLPAVIVFQALGPWDWTAAALCVLSTMVGLRYILVHQILDLRNDARAGTETFGTAHGVDFLCRLISRIVFPLEVASLGCAAITMGASLPAVWAAAGLYALWVQIELWQMRRLGQSISSISYALLADFYVVYGPLLLTMMLALRNVAFVAMLALNVVWLLRSFRLLIGDTARLFTARADMGEPMVRAGVPAGASAARSPPRTSNHAEFSGDVRRNEPCPCGSRKKYKHCHGRLGD
jgi:4-hydroxybenzoate polyprenyltransferase